MTATAFADRAAWTRPLFVPFVIPPGFDPHELFTLLRAEPLPLPAPVPPPDMDPGDVCGCDQCQPAPAFVRLGPPEDSSGSEDYE